MLIFEHTHIGNRKGLKKKIKEVAQKKVASGPQDPKSNPIIIKINYFFILQWFNNLSLPLNIYYITKISSLYGGTT